MKKLKFIYNPSSGDGIFKNRLDYLIERFQKSGYMMVPFRSSDINALGKAFFDIHEDYAAVCVSGGDGTLSSVINIMASEKLSLPIGIFPFGTANDFASHLNIPRDIEACCEIIENGRTKRVDIGRVNDKYFLNVCSAGLLTDVAYKTDTNMKNALGKLAYYMKGIEEIPRFTPFKMRLQYGSNVIEDNFLLLLILNGSSAGGFSRLAPNAEIDDGLLDVVAIKNTNITNILALFLKILRGEHIGDANLYNFQADKLMIACESGCETDIDGERGPNFPLDIEVKKHFLKVFVP
ncbi:MAG: YegS/Rv2252/BmrU family lipid kinase [Clostridiaceae bacterium]|jgi:YegS/Rv2252/BmrU family lipid kinase|nr:YegS/Rv2252/BmrU family lipid kinase [Clostridiaceae bacterium]